MSWDLIGCGSSTPKYFSGACLYGSGRERIAPSLISIPIYRHLSMIIICGFVMAVSLSLYVINIHAVLCRIFRIKLRVRFISAICIDHLKAKLLSDFNHFFMFHMVFVDSQVLSGTFVARIYLSVPVTQIWWIFIALRLIYAKGYIIILLPSS